VSFELIYRQVSQFKVNLKQDWSQQTYSWWLLVIQFSDSMNIKCKNYRSPVRSYIEPKIKTCNQSINFFGPPPPPPFFPILTSHTPKLRVDSTPMRKNFAVLPLSLKFLAINDPKVCIMRTACQAYPPMFPPPSLLHTLSF
jgi:hypothetical protein